MLLQAHEMRALIVLMDGIDEAAGMKEAIEEFVHREVVASGNRLVVTSRPEGVRLELYVDRFIVINLLQLSDEQQRKGKLKPALAAFVSPMLAQCRCLPLKEGEWLRVATDDTFHIKMTPRDGGPCPSWSPSEERCFAAPPDGAPTKPPAEAWRRAEDHRAEAAAERAP